MKHLATIWILLAAINGYGQHALYPLLDQVSTKGIDIPIEMPVFFDQAGGHLQGIQRYAAGEKPRLYLSGSSEQIAFMAVAEYGPTIRVLRVDTLDTAPYRHAGGFQITNHYLAVGVEDNHQRNTSKVLIYDLKASDKMPFQALHTIERNGEYEVATAGAVGITRMGETIVVAVANWDARHTDWYVCPVNAFESGENKFQKIGSLTMALVDKQHWSDSLWASYQNINLFPGAQPHELFLVGFGVLSTGENIADLYRVKIDLLQPDTSQDDQNHIEIVKLSRTQFERVGNTSFRYGAGLSLHPDGTWKIIACPEHLDNQSVIGMY